MSAETILGELLAEWRTQERPVFLVDEARVTDSELGDLVCFVLILTDSISATRLAEVASDLRDKLREPTASAGLKGSDLFGSSRRPAHATFRKYVRDAVANCRSVDRFATTGHYLKHLEVEAPGGILPLSAVPMPPIRGRELVPFMTMLKLAANQHALGAVQVDVLIDRSAQLGLAPKQLGIPDDQGFVIAPSEFNHTATGAPTSLQCATRFQIIGPAKPGPFRDLLLLPDSVAYMFKGQLKAVRARLAAGENVVVQKASGAEAAPIFGA